jgi:hypothetical protein
VVLFTAMVVGIATMCSLLCCIENARVVPTNYFLLFAFTMCFGYQVAFITTAYEPATVNLAVALTAGVVIALTIYALFTKADHTLWGGVLIVCLFSMIICSIFFMFIDIEFARLMICGISAVLFSLYVIYDT